MSGIEFVLHDPVSPGRVDDVKRAAEALHRVMMAEATARCPDCQDTERAEDET